METSPCFHYIKPGLCSKSTIFRCEEYIKHNEPTLSYSGVNSFMLCPRKYYLGYIKGIRVKEKFKSDASKISSYVDRVLTQGVISGEEEGEIWFAKAQAIINAYGQIIKSFPGNIQGQKEFRWQEDGCPQIHGFIDFDGPVFFLELKCTTRPDYYTNEYWIHDQLGTYFLSNPKYEYGIVLAIRVPKLERKGEYKDESIGDYKDRCFRVMCNTPVHYFKGYNKKKGIFGVKFHRSEFDLDGLRDRYKWISKQIQDCAKNDYWYQNRVSCMSPFKCDFLDVCNSGGISEDIYEYRER